MEYSILTQSHSSIYMIYISVKLFSNSRYFKVFQNLLLDTILSIIIKIYVKIIK